jgi:uncharacterized SAM-binding protein YcdF (DUF218 family)
MFFILSKIIGALLKPIFWILLCLLVALWKNKWRKKLVITSVIFLFLFGNKYLVNQVISAYEYPMKTLTAQDSFDVAVVLGGYSRNRLDNGRLELNESGDRLIAALDLLRTGKTKRIILSGGDGSLYRTGIDEANEVLIYLNDVGYDTTLITVDPNSKNTYENAVNTAALLKPYEKVILITSAFHMPRSVGCFKNQHVQFTAYPVDYLMDGSNKLSPESVLIPDGMAFEKWEIILKEWVGVLAYKVSGKI